MGTMVKRGSMHIKSPSRVISVHIKLVFQSCLICNPVVPVPKISCGILGQNEVNCRAYPGSYRGSILSLCLHWQINSSPPYLKAWASVSESIT